MAQNFNRDKRRIEETKKKRREEKRQEKLMKKNAALNPAGEIAQDPNTAAAPAETQTPETTS